MTLDSKNYFYFFIVSFNWCKEHERLPELSCI